MEDISKLIEDYNQTNSQKEQDQVWHLFFFKLKIIDDTKKKINLL